MPYSDLALAFSVITPSEQVRLEDRIAYAYLEKCIITQDKTGVVAWGRIEEEAVRYKIEIPVSSMAVLMLGPGTSITAAAMTSCTRSGCTVLFSGGGGVPAYSHATSLCSHSHWAIAQAYVVSHEDVACSVARTLYKYQLNIDMNPALTIKMMRGIEGQTVKNEYRRLAQLHHIKGFKRDVSQEDPVNQGLNLANAMLYGCAASVCAALGINPSLGIIHRGDARSLLFDLADVYKLRLSLPLAFECAQYDDFDVRLRTAMRKRMYEMRLLKTMLKLCMELFELYLPTRKDDRLIADEHEHEVAGHTLYELS